MMPARMIFQASNLDYSGGEGGGEEGAARDWLLQTTTLSSCTLEVRRNNVMRIVEVSG
jgi:hypothetical protein